MCEMGNLSDYTSDFGGKRSQFYPMQRVCIVVLYIITWNTEIPTWKSAVII